LLIIFILKTVILVRYIKVKRINQQTLTDLQLLANGWYQTIVRSQANTCYTQGAAVHHTRASDGRGGMMGFDDAGAGAYGFYAQAWNGCCIVIGGSQICDGQVLYLNQQHYSASIVGGRCHDYTRGWYTPGAQTPYTCWSYWTNANFRSTNFSVDTNRANIVVENNSATMARVTLYSSANANLGNLIANQNVRSIALNNRKDQTVNIEMLCTTVGAGNSAVNWFTKVFLREAEENQVLEDIQYEIELQINHSLEDSQVTTTVNTDNQNGNIYSRRIGITGVNWNDNRLRKYIREDFRNVRLVLETASNSYLLNHHMNSNGTFVVEYLDQFLKMGQVQIKLCIMPRDYVHENDVIDSGLPVLEVLDVFYEFPDFAKK
jgi:hypothetical protein